MRGNNFPLRIRNWFKSKYRLRNCCKRWRLRLIRWRNSIWRWKKDSLNCRMSVSKSACSLVWISWKSLILRRSIWILKVSQRGLKNFRWENLIGLRFHLQLRTFLLPRSTLMNNFSSKIFKSFNSTGLNSMKHFRKVSPSSKKPWNLTRKTTPHNCLSLTSPMINSRKITRNRMTKSKNLKINSKKEHNKKRSTNSSLKKLCLTQISKRKNGI